MHMIHQMDMSCSYKPVLIRALRCMPTDGMNRSGGIVSCFKPYYEGYRSAGLPAKKENSIFSKDSCIGKEVKRNILTSFFKRSRICRHSGIPNLWALFGWMSRYGND